ncbi:MAG: aminotransferase class V-fold PLP-dependent enzyme, partial [Myxococcota bacterium]
MIYLDHHAASPVNASVRARMEDVGATAWANPSSVHGAGRAARAILERARREVGEAFGVSPKSVVFTSGGTEACNLAIRGLFPVGACRGVTTTSVEHPAVHEPSQTFADRRQIPWSESFDVQLPHLATDELLAVQWVNHETGTVFPVGRWARQAKRDGARVFVDATQAAGKIPVQFDEIGADALAIASQKIGGPAGVGALLIRGAIEPLLQGGGQERGRRPGTPNVALLAGFGEACCQLSARRASMERITRLRDQLEGSLVELGAVLNGVEGPRVGTVVNASFRHLKGEELVAA